MRWGAVAVITGSVGIMVGALELSGVGIKLSGFLVELAGGDLVLTLLLVGMASLLLGMGLDSLPAYVTLAMLMAPALIKLGVPVIAAYLFVVYWGLASFFTPPLCIAVYIVITISGSGMWETGWEAMRLGIASFLIPFAFVLNPALLLRGEPVEILQAFTTALVGAVLLAAGIRGYALGRLSPPARLLVGAGGLSFIAPGLELLAAGILLVLAAFVIQWAVRSGAG